MSTATADPGLLSRDENVLLSAYRFVRRNRWLTLSIVPVVIALLAMALWAAMTGDTLNTFETEALDPALIRRQLVDHIGMTAWSTLLVILIAVPLGIGLTRPAARRLAEPVLAVASGGQAIPAYGLLVLFLVFFSRGFTTAVLALVVYSVLPVLRNTMVGLQQVDKPTVEAARGMGMTRTQVLRRIELPLAVPIILAGVRTALIINVGTAALGTFIGAGGLGETINTGLKLQQDFILFCGSALTALLALSVDWVAAVVEYVFSPRGLR